MKKIFAGFLFVVFLLGYLGLLLMPYHFYRLATSEGMSSDYLHLNKVSPSLQAAGRYRFVRTKEISAKASGLWKNYHFENFIIPLPVEHPLLTMVPHFKKSNGRTSFGYKLVDVRNNTMIEVTFDRPFDFRYDVNKQRLFRTPLFKNYIVKKKSNEVWKDLFGKNLLKSPFLQSIWLQPFPGNLNVMNLPLKEMAYNLFLLSTRSKMLPPNTLSIRYWSHRNSGIVKMNSFADRQGVEDKRFDYEKVLFKSQDGPVYPIYLMTRKDIPEMQSYKENLLRVLEYKMSLEESSIALYSEYKQLSYEQKLSGAGTNLLFASLSHEKKSRTFLKEMIQFLERGKGDKEVLKPLYKYAFDNFGSSFSTQDENLKETAKEKLVRKLQEDDIKERENILNMTLDDEPEKFSSDKEKVKRYLQKAKDSGRNRDKKQDSLIVD